MREDRSVIDLLNADYTFVNERLARHYGIPNVYGSQFRRVTVTERSAPRPAGTGSILTVTSYPNRTSPVQRGKWILTNMLGMPPTAAAAERSAAERKRRRRQSRCRCASAWSSIAPTRSAPAATA